MKVSVTSRKNNRLLKRIETIFRVEHGDGGTPPRSKLREELAKLLDVDLKLVYLNKAVTKTGTRIAVGEANIYDSIEQAEVTEPEHILARNVPPEPKNSKNS